MANLEDVKARRRQEAFMSALKTLDAQGCKYKVIKDDGQQFGDLVLQSDVVAPKRRDCKRYGYIEKISGMKVDDIVTIKADSLEDMKTLAACCCHYGSRIFGVRSIASKTNKDTLEVELYRKY